MFRRLMVPLALIAAAGCSQNPGAPIDAGDGIGQLALLNALGGSDATTLKLDGSTLALPTAGQSGTTPLRAGAHQLQALSGAHVVATVNFTMVEGKHRTAVLSGGSGHTILLVTAIDTATVPLANAVKMRVVHSAPDAPALDAYLFDADQVADSSTRLGTNLSYGTGTDPDFSVYATRSPGTYTVRLVRAGTDDQVLQLGPFPVNGGDVYSFVLTESGTGTLELHAVKEH